VPAALAGQPVGVYVGVSTRDFDRRMAGIWHHLDVGSTTGQCGAIVANRLSYLFGFTGPSIAVDLACASSLAAVHLACRALADEECTLALAGGVHLILSPCNLLAFSQGGVLARDGRCKPFSAQADGYTLGEGAGLVLLKPLAAALRDGDPIRAVIRGSAVNHNGRSNGMSAPYRAGQQQVMRKALAASGIEPASVDYIEAHAPGTPLGDAIEMQAIRDVYGQGRTRPCFVGSVKSNLGHAEAAAGIAALAKAVLAVEQGVLPATLQCEPPHPLLQMPRASQETGAVLLCDRQQAWPAPDALRRAGVSAFSFGGGNAHVLVEQAPPRPALSREATPAWPAQDAPRYASASAYSRDGSNAHPPLDAAPPRAALSRAATPDLSSDAGPYLLAVSARSQSAFEALCASYAGALDADPAALGDFCRATLLNRQHHRLRRAWVVRDVPAAIAALRGARPAPATASGCRIRVDGDPSEPAVAALAALLGRLGLRRVYVESDDPSQALLDAWRRATGGAPVITAAGAAAPQRTDVVLSAAQGDIVWRCAGDLPTQSLALAALLYERGAELEWHALFPPAPRPLARLPRYPFERRRNHAIPDALGTIGTGSPAPASDALRAA
jgi:acyl transferase domain-containing protein